MKLRLGATGAAAFVVGTLFSIVGPANAQQSASAQAMLEEVVVTARRREESLQDLPLSVSAITADAMQAQGIYDIMDISDHVPNVNFTNTGQARRHRDLHPRHRQRLAGPPAAGGSGDVYRRPLST